MNMAIQEFKGNGYSVEYDEKNHTVTFQGIMRLKTSKDYAPVSELLQSVYDIANKNNLILTLDFRRLQFINSSGIHALSKFVIDVRTANKSEIHVLGNPDIYWQHRSLLNLSKLWPKVQVDFG
jgi:hypothetical protein